MRARMHVSQEGQVMSGAQMACFHELMETHTGGPAAPGVFSIFQDVDRELSGGPRNCECEKGPLPM